MFCKIRYCSLILVVSLSTANATESNSYAKCSSIKGAEDRLKCYDSLAKKDDQKSSPNLPKGMKSVPQAQAIKEKGGQDKSVPLVGIRILKADIDSLSGKKIRIQGIAYYLGGDSFNFQESPGDITPIIVSMSALRQDQRQRISQQCLFMAGGCRIFIHGTAAKVNSLYVIYAEDITW